MGDSFSGAPLSVYDWTYVNIIECCPYHVSRGQACSVECPCVEQGRQREFLLWAYGYAWREITEYTRIISNHGV